MLAQKGDKFKPNGYDCEIIDVIDEGGVSTYVGKVKIINSHTKHYFYYVIVWDDCGEVKYFEWNAADWTKYKLKPKPKLPKTFIGKEYEMAIRLEYRGENDNHVCMRFGWTMRNEFLNNDLFSAYYSKTFKNLLRDVEDWLEENATKTEDGWKL